MSSKKKQHYIPQFYLRKFSPNGKLIYFWDKITDIKHYDSVSDVCQLKYFYNLPEGTSIEGRANVIDKAFVENEYFANTIEPLFSTCINNIISNKEEWANDKTIKPLNYQDKFQFAQLLAIQWFRLKSFSDYLDEMETSFIDGILDLFTEGLEMEQNIKIDYQDNRKELVEYLKKDKKINHANLGYMNENSIDFFATAISQNYWEFFVSENNDIYTSDFPITVYPHNKNVRPICQGLASYATELSFPLSKDILLVIWEKEFFSHKKIKDCCFSEIIDMERIKNNNLRYVYAKRQLFSYDGTYNDIII